MKRYLWILLFILPLSAASQVSMTVQLPPAGVLLKSQLWNVALASASARPVNVRIALRVTDVVNNQPLFTAITKSITLTRGAKQLKLADVMPVEYEYLSAAVDRSPNGLLAAGDYLACYSLVVEGEKGGDQSGEDCQPFVIEPLSPPMLNTPANESMMESRLPQFTWLPPAPLNMFGDLNYEFILTEVYPGQPAQEAIQQNIPVVKTARLKNLFLNYPATAPVLDTSRTYAWTVNALNGQQFAAQTEVWTFRVSGAKNPEVLSGSAYVQLKRGTDGAVATVANDLRFAYTNAAGDNSVKYEILSLEGNNKVLQSGTLKLSPGDNLLEVPVKRTLRQQYLLFRLVNGRQETWQLKFISTSI